jgi:hypothetical protein
MIFELLGSKVRGREIPLDFVVVKVQKVFMPKTMVRNVNESHGSIDPQHLQVKISLGATIPWSSKFFKLIHDARGNHVVAL